jgi:proline racemase
MSNTRFVILPTRVWRGSPCLSCLAPAHSPANHPRNAVTMSTRQSSWDNPNSFIGCIDRSPCGTGTSARFATMYARGEVGIGEDFRPESVTGTVFTGRILDG